MSAPDPTAARAWLADLQTRITTALEAVDGEARFTSDPRETNGGGISRPMVLEGGPVLERAAVNFSHTRGRSLPPAATARRPELVGRTYEAVSVSLITHPRNPHAPTSHANFRLFQAEKEGEEPVWWFGGGLDLTPYYPVLEDVVHWHRAAREACAPFGEEVYPRFKSQCDEYFYLRHRDETRGVGGLFFDDLNEGGYERCRDLWQSIGEAYLPAYLPILERRKDTPHGERARDFQLLRRGRYVEFNLLYDRGTLFGLQSGGRVEAILGSMPPEVRWRYDWKPEPDSPEAELYAGYLAPRDWLGEEG